MGSASGGLNFHLMLFFLVVVVVCGSEQGQVRE